MLEEYSVLRQEKEQERRRLRVDTHHSSSSLALLLDMTHLTVLNLIDIRVFIFPYLKN